ncbi:glycoside hydrolase family 19 protein [Bizionia paragorgiae]|uniref:Chitinase class I n=1 Tax=Bizionia paragorgiae TaxID=283786 RepID=A0A1H3YNR7_BIZPA|nr:glycoside hydrolase family 19 protein [Bizionia paragorgiae]SEA13175.1 Chitinase class I [Bizionia paragorgiae]
MNKNTKIGLGVLSGLLLFSLKKSTSSTYKMALNATVAAFGKLDSVQIKSLKGIINAFDKYGDGDGSKLAYIIATAWHESRLRPIKEWRASLGTPLRAIQDKYWHTGFYGRGFVQLTWQNNYRKMSEFLGVDLVNNPDLALKPEYATKILVYGMVNGSFTGKKLSDYISPSYSDFYNARRIVNGLDKAQLINDYAIKVVSYNA